jgi:Kelch motif
MPGFGKALNRIVQGREESLEEIETVATKRARGISQDEIVHDDKMQTATTTDFTKLRRILVIRGFVVYSFDPATGDWERCSDARRDRAYFETVLLNGFVYAIGSMNVTDAGTVEKFVIAENKWENVASLPAKIRSLAAAVITTSDGTSVICVCGGIDLDSMTSCGDVYYSQPSSDNTLEAVGMWQLQPKKMLTPRYRHATIVFEGSLWVMGGIVSVDDGEEYTSSTEIMDCHTGVWTAGPVMCARRAIDVAPIVVGGILYVVGGDVGKEVLPRIGDKLLGTIERYDPASKSFVVISTFPHQRKGFSSAALPGDDNIYCFGGREGDEDLTSWDAYNVSTNVWQSTLEPNTKYGELKMPFMDSLYGRAISLVP